MSNKYVIILIITILSGCVSKSHTKMETAALIMRDRPDSALSILSSLNRQNISGKHNKARFALLYSQALDKNWIDVDNDSLIRCAVDYYKTHGNDENKANAYYYLGIVNNNAGEIDKAMESFVEARIYAEKTDDQYLIGLIYSILGNLYYEQCSFEEAEKMYSIASEAFIKAGSTQNIIYTLHSKGLSLAYLNKYQEAVECLHNTVELAEKLKDTTTLLDVISAIGGIQSMVRTDSLRNRINKNYLFQMYSRYTENRIPRDHLPIIGYLYSRENKIDSARLFFEEYLDMHPKITEINRGIFAVLSSLEKQSGNYKKALEYECLFSFYTDSINLANKNLLIQNLEKKFRTEYLQKSFDTLQAKRKYEKWVFILIFLLIIVIMGMLLASYNRIIAVRNRQIAENESYVREVQTYYSILQEKYDSILMSAKERNDERTQALLSILNNRIQSLRTVLDIASRYENDKDAFFEKFKDHVRVASDNNIELAKDIISIANLSCYGIIDHLERLSPKLTQRELCYCGFICLGFSPDSIRILYNHTNIYSIYTLRSKIRSKLGITNSTKNLEKCILMMMDELRVQ